MSLSQYVKLVGWVSPRATVVGASRQMCSRGIGTVVVVSDDYRPIGLLTDRDITMRVVAVERSTTETTVGEVMTSGVVSLSEQASIWKATEAMRDHGVRRIPITDENGRVTGIVTLDDLALLLGMEIGNLANAIVTGLSRLPEARAAAWHESD
jgi:signal-transduction protein with cAMP-binding, CBS, and nucleotidyltransferase domain